MKRKKYIRISLLVMSLIMILITIGVIRNIYLERNRSLFIIYIPKVITGSDFWPSVIAGAEMAAKENEVTLEIMSPNDELDTERQNELILEAIEKKPDAIVVSPHSYEANLEALIQVKEAGIKLVLIDSAVSKNIQDAIVATDNYEAGQKMGEYILQNIKDDTVIGIVSHVKNTSTAIEREQGFRDAIGNYEEQIVEVIYSDSDHEKATKRTKELLNQYKIDYLVCLNEYSAVGAGRAVKEMGLVNEITMIGFDNSMEEIKMLEEGLFSAIVVQRAYSMGYLGIEAAVKCIKTQEKDININSGSLLVTKEAMYNPENQELLFPFFGD